MAKKQNDAMIRSAQILCFILLLAIPGLVLGQTASEASKPDVDHIQLVVSPGHLVLGETTKATVHAVVSNAAGAELTCDDIRMHASQGEISNLKQAGPGEYTADFVLPEDFFPRFALIAASASCSGSTVTGSVVVALFGTGRVEVKAKPFSDVVLEIGKDTFGPAKTNASGKVKIPIVVGPGVETGIVGDKVIDLNLPPVNRIVTIPENSRIPTGAKSETVIRIYTVDNVTGEPLLNADLDIRPERGSITRIEPDAPGVYRAYYVPPKQVGNGEDIVTIALRGDAVSETQMTFQIVSGNPARIQIEAQPKRYTAGTGSPVAITVHLTDKNGNPTDGEIDAATSIGTLDYLQSEGKGLYRTLLKIPDNFGGNAEARITIMSSQDRNVKASALVGLDATHPATIEIDGVSRPVPTDGWSGRKIEVRVEDGYGNPVMKHDLAVSVTKGSTPQSAIPKGDTYIIPYTPPLSRGRAPKKSVITASIGDVSATTTVPLTSKTHVIAITPRAGYLTNLKHVHAPYFAVPIELNLWFIVTGLHLIADFGYYFSKATYDDEDFTSTFHAVPLSGALGYRLALTPKVYMGWSAGAGAHLIWNQSERAGSYNLIDTAVQLGIHGAMSVCLRAGPGFMDIKAGYIYANSKKISSLSGNIGGLNIQLGYRFELF